MKKKNYITVEGMEPVLEQNAQALGSLSRRISYLESENEISAITAVMLGLAILLLALSSRD